MKRKRKSSPKQLRAQEYNNYSRVLKAMEAYLLKLNVNDNDNDLPFVSGRTRIINQEIVSRLDYLSQSIQTDQLNAITKGLFKKKE